MWGTEREQPRPSPTRRCAWQNTCANATVERVGVGLITGTAEILVCKTENQDRRLDLIEPSVCLLLGDLPTRGQRVHTMECVFCACLDAQVHPIQGAALELSVPFQRAGEPGCAGSTAIRMALLKTEDGAVAGRFSLYHPRPSKSGQFALVAGAWVSRAVIGDPRQLLSPQLNSMAGTPHTWWLCYARPVQGTATKTAV